MASEYKPKLLEIFPSHSHQQIDEIISLVLNNDVIEIEDDNDEDVSEFDKNLDRMISLLLESGDSTLSNEAASNNAVVNTDRYFKDLTNVFPECDVNYLQQFCRENAKLEFDDLVDKLTSTDFPIQRKDQHDVWDHLKQMLPNADPIYLRNHARVLVNRTARELQEFIEQCVEKEDYPTMQQYLEKAEALRFYTDRFNVEEYLKEIPNPFEKYLNPRDSEATLLKDPKDVEFAINILLNLHPCQRKNEILKIFNSFHHNLAKTHSRLKNTPKALKYPRPITPEELNCKNIPLLQEVLFVKHEKAIRQYSKTRDETYKQALEQAKIAGILKTCNACFYDELIPEECVFCEKMCSFCKECLKRGTETAIGDGKLDFACFSLNCTGQFNYRTLQIVLDRNTFSRLFRRKQFDEIKKAKISGLEECPFCDFSMIPLETDKIFKCQNVSCMKESCRECGHEAHIPLRCSEIEYDEDVKIRTYIENKMTDALLRVCWNCSKKFYKESGCNKMACVCGALMCYVCGQAIRDYTHFGESIQGKCPLYTDQNTFHLQRIMAGAQQAKSEMGVDLNPAKLKIDPTQDFIL